MSANNDSVDVDGFLDSAETVGDLMEKEFGTAAEADVLDRFSPPETTDTDEVPSGDRDLIKQTGMAQGVATDLSDVSLAAEISDEEVVAATYGGEDRAASDPIANTIYKATEETRHDQMAADLSKRELLNLAAEAVEDFVSENVQKSEIDDATLRQMKFKARQRIVEHLEDHPALAGDE